MKDMTDGGYKSRKWVSYIITSALIIVSGIVMGAEKLAQIVFGLISAYAIFCGANVGRDFVMTRGNVPNTTSTESTTSTKSTSTKAPPKIDPSDMPEKEE